MSPNRSNHYATGFLALILLFLLFALIYYRDDIFQSLQDPGQPYQTYKLPPKPDYNQDYAWVELPNLTLDRHDLPQGGDVFVIVPELYKGGDHWNVPIERFKTRQKIQTIIRPNYVAPYRSAGRVFAPYYRQASMYTFMTNREDAKKAQSLAYQDIRAAFEIFLEHNKPERPIIIAGHGQGASHAQRLLADYFQGPLSKRLAAAYIIDHPMPLSHFDGQLSAQTPCESETDTMCVVAWGAFMPRDEQIARRFVSRLKVYNDETYKAVNGTPLLCINPLLWKRSNDYAPRRLHRGGVAALAFEPDIKPAPLTKQVGTQCEDGILYVDRPKSRSLRRPIRIGGKYRTLPSNLFYEDIRLNAAVRVSSMLRSGHLPKLAPALDTTDIIELQDSPVTPVIP